MGHIQGRDRHQEIRFPERLDDYISEENPVRFIDAFVDELDLHLLGFKRARAASTGRPPYHPGDLLKLYLYGYLNRLRSSRRLERETQRNVELMWLLKRLQPDFKTIADFRKNNLEAIRGACREFTLLCKKLDLFAGELIAIDGSKFRADNARGRNYTKDKLRGLLRKIDERVEEYLQDLDAHDEQESKQKRDNAQTLQEKIARLKERKQHYQALEQTLETSGENQISLTDPESRSMLMNGRVEVCYNVQTAVDSKHKLIVAQQVTNVATDRDFLSMMALAANEVLASDHLEVVADQGYYHGHEVKTCLEAGIPPYVPRPITSANGKLGLFSKDDFRYDRETDTYTCPAGERLEFRFDTVELGRHIRYYATRACKQCVLKAKCTRSRDGRRLTRWIDEHLLEEMEERMQGRPEIMDRRRELVEHPYGTMKRWWDQSYFLMRGLEKVRTEFSLTVLAYNLRRVLKIVGMARLMAALS